MEIFKRFLIFFALLIPTIAIVPAFIAWKDMSASSSLANQWGNEMDQHPIASPEWKTALNTKRTFMAASAARERDFGIYLIAIFAPAPVAFFIWSSVNFVLLGKVPFKKSP